MATESFTTEPTDDDERQEYACLLLEGYSEAEARRLARAANDAINSKRLSGPTTGDTRHGHGVRPLISDMTMMDIYENVPSITMEQPPSVDIDVSEYLGMMTPRQREAVELYFGFTTGHPVVGLELSERLGLKEHGRSSNKGKRQVDRGVDAVRRQLGV